MTVATVITEPFEAWWFVPEDGRLGNGDGRVVVVGETLRVAPPLELCARGLHYSVRAIDALQYAPSATIARVRISGECLTDTDKGCATERTPLWIADATRTLQEFAIWCAEGALTREREAGREPDARSWAALDVKRRWLDGQATDAELDAAWDAARDAAWDAARDAAWDAARDAAWAAAWDAAWAAARDAARDAAWDAARAAQNMELERRLLALAQTTPTTG